MTGELHRGPKPTDVGSYAFDEATLRSLVNDWDELARSYETSLASTDAMIRVVGPGNEFASESFAASANKSGLSYRNYLKHNIQYCDQQRDIFQQALNRYLEAEDTSAAEFNRINRNESQPEV